MAAKKTPLQRATSSPAVLEKENQSLPSRENSRTTRKDSQMTQWNQKQVNESQNSSNVYFVRRKQRPDHPMDSLL